MAGVLVAPAYPNSLKLPFHAWFYLWKISRICALCTGLLYCVSQKPKRFPRCWCVFVWM